jgi:hypothetical protein
MQRSKLSSLGRRLLARLWSSTGEQWVTVKAVIDVGQWCVAARTSCTIEGCNIDVFRALVVPNAKDVTPMHSLFDNETPVVVASVTQGAATIFGSTKLTGGARLGSWSADKMELVYFQPTQQMRCWWIMS